MARGRGMHCASRCFRPRRTRRTRGRWTWLQRRDIPGSEQTQWLRSKPDYFLFREQDWRRIKRCRWTRPQHHDSDHRALIVDIRARRGEIHRYVDTCALCTIIDKITRYPPCPPSGNITKIFSQHANLSKQVLDRDSFSALIINQQMQRTDKECGI